MKETPIIFSSEMVNAIQEERKTQTRRIVKPIPALGYPKDWCEKINTESFKAIVGNYTDYCPYGKAGDLLWVRETFGYHDSEPDVVFYKADGETNPFVAIWRPSIHMFRKYSRITLEIVSVRVERLQDISNDDAIAEGIYKIPFTGWTGGKHTEYGYDSQYNTTRGTTCCTAKDAYCRLWNSINGKKEGCGWQSDPFVWVVEFKRLEASRNENA
jgi:hypothetical protein